MNHETRKGETMNRKTYDAVAAKIAAIKADPIAWARTREQELLATCEPSYRRHAKLRTESELAELAADELAFAESILPAEAPAADPPVDMDRLMRANRRAHEAIENGRY